MSLNEIEHKILESIFFHDINSFENFCNMNKNNMLPVSMNFSSNLPFKEAILSNNLLALRYLLDLCYIDVNCAFGFGTKLEKNTIFFCLSFLRRKTKITQK